MYDNIGNITSVKTYGYTTGDISGDPTREDSFTYHSTVKDRLTKFNNISISYNSNGCLSYYDKNYAWTKGKLSRVYKGSAQQPGTLYEDCVFTYDAYGRRLSKSYTRDPNTASTSDYSYTYNTNYTYDNSGRLIRERCVEAYTYSGGTSNTRDITYLYDESGIVGAIQKLGSTEETFYFDRNIKGDVIGIFNSSGTKVASYSYDAWGNCTTKTLVSNNFSSYNPIRYRGYYYDRETKLYYLNARYYNPEWRRFISPDSVDYLDPETPNGLNLYAYCNNDPVNYKQRPVSSGGSITDSALSVTLGGGFMPIINPSSGGSSIFNSVLANGSFRNGLFFGKGTITGLYASGHARAQISLKNGKFVLGAFGKFSLLNATGQIGIGNDDFSVSLVGVGDIGTVSAMAGILIDPSKNTYFAGIEAKAAVFTARGGVQFEIFDTQIEVGGSVSALSAGFQFGVGIKDGEFYYKSGFAVLFGYDFYIRVKFA